MKEEKTIKRYKLELTAEQMRVIKIALEEYFRLRLAQDSEFSNDMAALSADLSPENPNHDRIFDRYIWRRDHLREIMHAYFRVAFEPYGCLHEKTNDMMIAECIWDAIRYELGQSRWNSPFQIGSEPVPKIEEIEGELKA